ncbi:MAG: hypothetical protein IJ945_02050 [Oscillospiraceae bacterium]|nr:hypothetical protein [Oscillospiraceae bacterium]
MGYCPNAKCLTIACGNFDLDEKYFEKEIKELKNLGVDVDIHFVDSQRIIEEIEREREREKDKGLPHVGGFELPNLNELLIYYVGEPLDSFIFKVVLETIIVKAVEKFLDKFIKKPEEPETSETDSSLEVLETKDIKYLQVKGLSDKSAKELAEKYIESLNKKE